MYTVRHVKIIISYQWLNIETKECLSSVKKCREQWCGTAAHRLLKHPGPERFTSFFQNWFYVLHIIFLNFIKEPMNIFFSFAPIQALIELSVFNRFTFIFTVSRAVYLDLRVTIPLVAYAPMVSSILSIISEVMKKNSTRMVRKRKYPRYFDSCLLFPLPHYSRTRKKRREEERRIIIKYQ